MTPREKLTTIAEVLGVDPANLPAIREAFRSALEAVGVGDGMTEGERRVQAQRLLAAQLRNTRGRGI